MAIAGKTSPYDNFDDQSIKKLKDKELLAKIAGFARITESNKKAFEEFAAYNLGFLISVLKDEDEAKRLFARLMGFAGFAHGDYEVVDRYVNILNISNFKAKVDLYREKKAIERARRVVLTAMDKVDGVRDAAGKFVGRRKTAVKG